MMKLLSSDDLGALGLLPLSEALACLSCYMPNTTSRLEGKEQAEKSYYNFCFGYFKV